MRLQNFATSLDRSCTFANVHLTKKLLKNSCGHVVHDLLWCLVPILVFLCAPSLRADSIIDFEALADSTVVTTQYGGLTFTNSIVLSSGISLNEFEFPPHSGSNVISDNNGPLTIDFSSPIFGFAGYFTHLEPLTITALDSAGDQIASAASLYSNNLALSGEPGSSPNELLSLSSGIGIAEIRIVGDPAGGSFVGDDFSFITSSIAVPESSVLILLLGTAPALFTRSCIMRLKKPTK